MEVDGGLEVAGGGGASHLVTPPNARSTTKADILSFTSPVVTSLMGVLAKTVKISAVPPLLEVKGVQ